MVLDDKQLFRNAAKLAQDNPDLFDRAILRRSASTISTPFDAPCVSPSSQQAGDDVIPRLQHRADGRYLVGLIGDEMNEHFKPRVKKGGWDLSISKQRVAMTGQPSGTSLTGC